MPELPEVETVCRVMRRALMNKKIKEVEIVKDTIIFGAAPPEAIRKALKGRTVNNVCRRGKTFWLELDDNTTLYGHLGMSGWIRELGTDTVRLKEHGDAPLDDENGRPRFLKMLITAEDGTRVSFTDARRLGRVWLGGASEKDAKVKKLGPDALDDLPKAKDFEALYVKRHAPIKALLMDQGILSGIGNWVADEVLYHAKIAPARAASSLSSAEYTALRKAIVKVLEKSVEVGADSEKFPNNWLFHHRWGGSRGADKIGKHDIKRDTVGGRTTAWVPAIQK